RDRPTLPVILTLLEEQDLAELSMIDSQEGASVQDRPGDREALEPQVALYVVEQLERLHSRAITLVDEGEDRRPAAVTHFEELPRPLLHPAAIVEKHHGAVRGDERPI